jgi:hypothetical protein
MGEEEKTVEPSELTAYQTLSIDHLYKVSDRTCIRSRFERNKHSRELYAIINKPTWFTVHLIKRGLQFPVSFTINSVDEACDQQIIHI